MSDFADSLDHDSLTQTELTRPFDDDDVVYNDNNSESQQFESFTGNDDVFETDRDYHPPVYGDIVSEENGGSDGPVLPSPLEMQAEEGFALREWRRENALKLEEKEKNEKEILSQILKEADEYKVEFHRKREITCENNKAFNREKEKVFVSSQEKFHAEADKNYWKTIAELIPNEVPVIEKRGKKDQEKKPGIVVIQGPKPGKPTELSRMRQILIKLKHNTPPHLKPSPPSAPSPSKDAKTGDEAAPLAKAAPVITTPEAVAVA
ncbi:clathrin light chain 2-like [Mercurialis annua]|uniref:clathrin light chain 2-like n=1 Tax=Mercurialis annua TaxID=3986 RepID=UPI00216070F3|nr:clathrin light chain 2-like [Mercurialis annua]